MHHAPCPAEEALRWARVNAAALLGAAGVFHLLFAPVHFAEGSHIGFFFLIVGVNQLAAAALLLVTPSLPLVGLTILGTLMVIATYVASRTSGLPFFAEVGELEAVGVYDLLTTLMEAIYVGLLAMLAVSYLASPGPRAGEPL